MGKDFVSAEEILRRQRGCSPGNENDVEVLNERQAGIRYYRKLKEVKKKYKNKEVKHVTITSVLLDFAEKAKEVNRRLGLLRETANVVIKDVSLQELTRKRKTYDEAKNDLFPLDAAWCWLCNKREATQRHHVVLLKHGGPELAKANIVYLCSNCHAIVHPWLFSTSLHESDISRIILLCQEIKEGKCPRNRAEIELFGVLDSLFSDL